MFGFFQHHSIKKSTIRKWQKEHRKLGKIITRINEAYAEGDHKTVRKKLGELSILANEHLIDEDKAFFEFKRQASADDPQAQKAVKVINEFRDSFHRTKKALADFLLKYAGDESIVYDETFKKEMDAITSALTARITTEETKFYPLISG